MSRAKQDERSRLEKAADAVKDFLNIGEAGKAGEPPLGSGAADKAGDALKGRKRRIDDAIERDGG